MVLIGVKSHTTTLAFSAWEGQSHLEFFLLLCLIYFYLVCVMKMQVKSKICLCMYGLSNAFLTAARKENSNHFRSACLSC